MDVLAAEYSDAFIFHTGFLATFGEKNSKAAAAQLSEEVSPSQVMRRAGAFSKKISDFHKFLVFPVNLGNNHWCLAIAVCDSFRRNLIFFVKALQEGNWKKKRN
jgi:hypothetical protein